MPRRTSTTPATDPRIARAAQSASPIFIMPAAAQASDPPERTDKRHPVTGCRADTLFGTWLMPAEHLRPLVDAAWQIVEAGELAEIAERSAEMRRRDEDDTEGPPPLSVDSDGIAHLSISGPLTKHPTSLTSVFGGSSYRDIRAQFREARVMHAAGKVRGIFVDADSWGGTFEGCTEGVQTIRETAAVVPVAFHAEDKCCSGMQWLATPATQLTGGRGAMFGSVGAKTSLIDRSKNFERQGLKPYVFSTGEEKVIGEPGIEITPEQREIMQKHVEQVGAPFIEDVAQARKLTPEQLAEVRRAGVHIGSDAVRVGLCDRICTREQAIADFKTYIAQGGHRGTAPSNQPAAIGVPTMPAFNTQQLTRARALPNCASVGENDVDTVIGASEQLAANLKTRDDSITKITAERDEARKALPPALTPELKSARVAVARSRIDGLAAKGLLNAAMKAKVEGMLGKAGEENDAVLTGPHGQTQIERVLDVFEVAPRVAPPAGSATGAQIPGANATPQQQQQQQGANGNNSTGVIALNDPNIETNPLDAGVQQGDAYRQRRLREMGHKVN